MGTTRGTSRRAVRPGDADRHDSELRDVMGAWFYQFLDQEMGPVEFQALQQLAAEGTVSESDLVRSADSPEWVEAGSVPGLIPEHADVDDLAGMLAAAPDEAARSARRRRGTDCYYRTGRGEIGPISFEELAVRAQNGEIGPEDQIRLSRELEWMQAGMVVGLFGTGDPDSTASGDQLEGIEIVSDVAAPAPKAVNTERDRVWYCRILNQEIGPFTFDDVHAMAQSGQLGRTDDLREGTKGHWMSAGGVVGLFPKARRKQKAGSSEFDVDGFLSAPEEAEEQSAPQHIAPQRRAVAIPLPRPSGDSERTPARKVQTPAGSDADIDADRTVGLPPAAPSAPAVIERPSTVPAAAHSSPYRPTTPTPAPRPAPIPVPKTKKSMGNPLAGLGGSMGSAFGGLSTHWKPLAAVAVLLGVAAVLYGGLPFNFSRGPAVYEETLALWQRAQLLHQPETSDANWQAFKAEIKPRVDQLKTELAEEASARDRLLQLMLYCYRDCLPAILDGGPNGAAEKWKEMDGYMKEAGTLAK